jgi:hypothetical protein
MSAPNPNRIHFKAGTGDAAPRVSFQGLLKRWYAAEQTTYATQRELAAALECSEESVQAWFAGKTFPTGLYCDRLFEITHLDCFSVAGRVAAREEHEKKKGLSRAAIQRRASRQYLNPTELAQCHSNPDLAFTIRGDDWIVCLECGLLLKQIRDQGSAAHLKEHEMTDERYRVARYGPNVSLVCRALSAARRKSALEGGHLKPDAGLANLRRPPKGRKMPPEFSRKTSNRMRRQRRPEWAKPTDDIEFVWSWLIEGDALAEVGRKTGFTLGGVHRRLASIVGKPVRRKPPQNLEAAKIAFEIAVRCGENVEKVEELKQRMEELLQKSRHEVATRDSNREARAALLLIPHARAWVTKYRRQIPKLSPFDMARRFAATTFKYERPTRKSGPDKTPAEKTTWFQIGEQVDKLMSTGMDVVAARRQVGDKKKCDYSTIASYHRQYRNHKSSPT